VLALRQVALHRVVERADARAQPQVQRGAHGQRAVVDHHVRQHPGVAAADLVAGRVGQAGAGRQLATDSVVGTVTCGSDGLDVRSATIRPITLAASIGLPPPG